MIDPLKVLSSPLFWTSMTIPGFIAGALVALRWDKQKGFRAQSSSDFLVVPLTIDIGIVFFPDSYIGIQGINLATTRSFALLLAMFTIMILVWNVKIVEPTLDENDKAWWFLGWMACLSLVGLHATHFAGVA